MTKARANSPDSPDSPVIPDSPVVPDSPASTDSVSSAIEALTVQRLGGMLPTLRPQRRVDASALDHPVRQALHDLFSQGCQQRAAAHPEAFSYVFSAQVDGQPRSISLAWAQVPDALKHLLPDPQA